MLGSADEFENTGPLLVLSELPDGVAARLLAIPPGSPWLGLATPLEPLIDDSAVDRRWFCRHPPQRQRTATASRSLANWTAPPTTPKASCARHHVASVLRHRRGVAGGSGRSQSSRAGGDGALMLAGAASPANGAVGGLIVITANSVIDGVERRRVRGSHHRHGRSRRDRLTVISMKGLPGPGTPTK